jgi:hypothetical protein
MLVQTRTGSRDQGPIPTPIGDTYDRGLMAQVGWR